MDWDEFGKTLERLGFFRYLPSGQRKNIPRLLRTLQRTHYMASAKVYRDYPADEKSIAGGGVEYFLRKIRRVLKHNNVVLRIVMEKSSPGVYYGVSLNGIEYLLCSAEDFNQESYYIRHLISKRVFAIVNKLLKDADSEERIYSRDGGNDHWAIFLTKGLYDFFSTNGFSEEMNGLTLYEE